MNRANPATVFMFAFVALLTSLLFAGLVELKAPKKEKAAVEVKQETVAKSLRLISTSTPVLRAAAAYSIYVDPEGKERVLYSRNAEAKLGIASITKLMTAIVADKLYADKADIHISQKAVDQYETAGKLKLGQVFRKNELMYPLLIESSNDAAYAFAETYDLKKFVGAMNDEAHELGLKDTSFVNAHGLDGVTSNLSTARDVAELAKYFHSQNPDLFSLTALKDFHLVTKAGDYDETLTNTDKLLGDETFPFEILGGKTGETPKAKQTLVLVVRDREWPGYFVNVVLGSTDRIADMKELSEWIKGVYVFK